MTKLLFSFLLALCFYASNGQDTEKKIETLVSAYANEGKFNGTVLVAHKGKIVYQKGFGWRRAEEKVPHTEGSIFQIGSITKQFTSAVIMQLQQEKKLSVQDKLEKYFAGFPNGNKITIEHLLTHTSGLFNYTSDSTLMNRDVTKSYSSADMIAIFKSYPPDFEPGSRFSYSNTGYSMLGYIIEKVTGKPYEAVVRQRILQPLGMSSSGFDFTHLDHPARSKGYFLLQQSNVVPAPVVDSTISYSAGALYSTVGDLYKWERAIGTDKILQPASWKAVFTPYKQTYGYGWSIDTLFGQTYTAHSGGIHGFASFLMRFPQEELAVIIIDNASSESLSAISRSLAALMLGKPYKIPEPKKALAADPAILRQYVGEYELAPGFTITVTLDGSQLRGQATGQPAFDLFAEKENLFFLKVVEAKVEFVRDAQGTVTEMILYQNGQQPRGKKIK
ncbi:MAG TPA: serine hydrolase [Flavisolibacter sp.]|nr:serine hydrolase [Flavisolibacter sp.]